MKVILSSLAVLAFTLSLNLAHASGNYLNCTPEGAEAFNRTSVWINPSQIGGKFSATLNHGGRQSYTVEQLNIDDISLQVFQGQGFTLIFNTNDSTASVVASLNGKPVALVNLTCTANENNPHPSVTASN